MTNENPRKCIEMSYMRSGGEAYEGTEAVSVPQALYSLFTVQITAPSNSIEMASETHLITYCYNKVKCSWQMIGPATDITRLKNAAFFFLNYHSGSEDIFAAIGIDRASYEDLDYLERHEVAWVTMLAACGATHAPDLEHGIAFYRGESTPEKTRPKPEEKIALLESKLANPTTPLSELIKQLRG